MPTETAETEITQNTGTLAGLKADLDEGYTLEEVLAPLTPAAAGLFRAELEAYQKETAEQQVASAQRAAGNNLRANTHSGASPSRNRWDEHNAGDDLAEPGLTKREHFAALALQGILAGDWIPADMPRLARQYASDAVALADALLAALADE